MAGWPSYLEQFHRDHAGVTEAVFARLESDGPAVDESILGTDVARGRVLEVGCGSAPLADRLHGRWGIDRSAAELALARRRGARPLTHADATALPVATGAHDVVVCAMSLMLLQPLDEAIAELARALRSGGRVVAVLPATSPLSLRDRARYVRLLVALGRRRFDYPNELTRLDDALQRGGFDVVRREERRFHYPVDGPEATRLLVDSLYLPGTPRARVDAAHEVARRWIGSSIGVPLLRLVAVH